jgi:hypothetical protein
MFCLSIYCSITPYHYRGLGARCTFGANIATCWACVIDLPSFPVDEYKVASTPACGYIQYNHLVIGRYILTVDFSPVRQARSIHTMFLSTDKVQYSRLLHRPLHLSLDSSGRSLTRMDFSSEGLVMGGHSVHFQEESGLARDQRMPFAWWPE